MSAVDLPVRILFVFTGPSDNERLRVDVEVNKIRERIERSRHRDNIQFFLRFAIEPGDIPHDILDVQPHIVHFSGHGTRSEDIMIADLTGARRSVRKDALIRVFGILKSRVPVRLVVLNACHTKPQAEALTEHVSCAIGMNEEILDEAAINFSAAFYGAIGFGCSIREAFELGRNELRLLGIEDSDIPELFPLDEPQRTDVPLVERPSPGAFDDARALVREEREPRAAPARASSTMLASPGCRWAILFVFSAVSFLVFVVPSAVLLMAGYDTSIPLYLLVVTVGLLIVLAFLCLVLVGVYPYLAAVGRFLWIRIRTYFFVCHPF